MICIHSFKNLFTQGAALEAGEWEDNLSTLMNKDRS